MTPQQWDGHCHLPKSSQRCPTCHTQLEIDIEPFEGTILYCRKCQKVIKLLPIQMDTGDQPHP